MIRFNEEVCGDLGAAMRREWLETNGLGGFASSTITGLNTRRYHGLLVAATKPPVGRLVLLSKQEEVLIIDGRRYELSANQYPGAIHPQGYRYLKEFRLDPFPIFTYEVEGLRIEKTVFMIYGENSTVIEYRLLNSDPITQTSVHLETRPMVAFRDYHSTVHENSSINPHVITDSSLAIFLPYIGLPALRFSHNAIHTETNGDWYRNFEYEVERRRGLDFTEDLFSPFVLRFDLMNDPKANVVVSTERRDRNNLDELKESEIRRRASLIAASPHEDEFVRQLVAAADQFIVARGGQKTVIAGYHWFSDWGRDTMIALPGLTITTGRYDIAKSILMEFARHLDQGMLPNRFPDAGESPEYNTVDATLWFFEAVRSLLVYTKDYEFVRSNFYDALIDVIDWHMRGTRYGIRVDEDGLLASGADGIQLTWMDAKVGDWVVTPRRGKPVEIQALWYNALRVMENLADHFGDKSHKKQYNNMASRAKKSFNKLFWNEEAGCLFDVIDGDTRDNSIRPNQILAVSLTNTMLARDKAKRVVETVERHLLTPYGLRTLAPEDPQYRSHYEGDSWSRDSAYHQGTVWAWLMGPFITAYVKTNGQRSKTSRARALDLLSAFRDHMSDAGLGQVSEIFDGDVPYNAVGCIAQAWSVAELLRVAVEDVFNVKPKSGKSARAAVI